MLFRSDQMRIHRLLVGSTTDIQGIVTQTDIITAVQRKLEEACQARLQTKSDVGRLADSAMTNLSSIQDLFQEILCHHRFVGESAKTAESRENAASPRSAISECDQDEATLHGRILKELETRILQTQDSLAKLASMVGVPTSGKPAPTAADHLLGWSETGV